MKICKCFVVFWYYVLQHKILEALAIPFAVLSMSLWWWYLLIKTSWRLMKRYSKLILCMFYVLVFVELEVHSDELYHFNYECLCLEIHVFERVYVMFISCILPMYRAWQINMRVLTVNELLVPLCHLQVSVRNLTIFSTEC